MSFLPLVLFGSTVKSCNTLVSGNPKAYSSFEEYQLLLLSGSTALPEHQQPLNPSISVQKFVLSP